MVNGWIPMPVIPETCQTCQGTGKVTRREICLIELPCPDCQKPKNEEPQEPPQPVISNDYGYES